MAHRIREAMNIVSASLLMIDANGIYLPNEYLGWQSFFFFGLG